MSNPKRLPQTPMPPRTPEGVFLDILELHALGMAMKRQQFRRRNPGWTEEAVESAMREWLRADPLPGQSLDGWRTVTADAWTARSSTR